MEELSQILSPIELNEHNELPLSRGCSFVATIYGKDYLSKFGSFAFALHYEPDDTIFHTEVGRASREGSHNEALVVAVLRVVELAPVNAKIEFHSTSSYIVEVINTLCADWKENGWENNQWEQPKHAKHWREIDARVETRNLRISANRIGDEVAENTVVMKFLRDSADQECKRFMSSAGG